MANLLISDEMDAQLQQTAERLGCSKEQLVLEALASRVDYEEAPLTEAQIARMREGIAQLDRGEGIPSEQVDQWFAEWFKELEAR